MTIALFIVVAWCAAGVGLALLLGPALAVCEARGARALPRQLHTTVIRTESLSDIAA